MKYLIILLLFLQFNCIHVHCGSGESSRHRFYDQSINRHIEKSEPMSAEKQNGLVLLISIVCCITLIACFINDISRPKLLMFDMGFFLFWAIIAGFGALANDPPLSPIPFGLAFGSMFTLTKKLVLW